MPVTILTAQRQHLDTWLTLRQAIYHDVAADDHLQEMQQFLSADDKACLLAHGTDGEICGMLELTLRNIVDGCLTSPVGYIEGIYVRETDRGRGIARQLTRHAEQWCRDRGCREIATDAEWDNSAAQRYHLHMGFEETYRVIEYRKTL